MKAPSAAKTKEVLTHQVGGLLPKWRCDVCLGTVFPVRESVAESCITLQR